MYVLALILFVGGIVVLGISFALVPLQALFFVLGILLVSAAIAVPIHFGNRL